MASAQRVLSFVDSGGHPLRLGDEVGQGGEGAVYAIAGRDAVAKIYHKSLPAPKQEKLAAMVTVQIPALRTVAAWPLDVIHERAGGPVVGLIVPKVTGYEEIHQLYSPLDRKTHFPDADWTFLVRAAANTAAATATMHAHGIVIGDINQNVFMVAKDATVKLIDCDSFQVEVNGQRYPCTVGVPDFTPPELQGQLFGTTVRTADHDAFGLAVILFHLLCMGRHPYAGRYLGDGDMPIQRAIVEGGYAYGRQAARVQMAPPPYTLPMAALGAEVTGLFESAFDPSPSTGVRPMAAQWIGALERLLDNLRSCARVSAHKYLRTLPACPWCALEAAANTAMFNDSQSATLPPPFDLPGVMNRIASVPAPDEANMPTPAVIAMRPASVPGMPPVAVGAAPRRLSRAQYDLEYAQRQAARRQAQEAWERFTTTWEQEATLKPYTTKVSEGQELKEDYIRLEQELRTERDQAMMSAKSAQLHAYLRSYHIDQASIAGMGPQQIAMLAAKGVTTAAEVKRTRLQSISEYGEEWIDALLRWRSEVEQRFHFDATQALSAEDRARLERTYRPRFLTIQAKLIALPGELDQIQRQIQVRRVQLRQECFRVGGERTTSGTGEERASRQAVGRQREEVTFVGHQAALQQRVRRLPPQSLDVHGAPRTDVEDPFPQL